MSDKQDKSSPFSQEHLTIDQKVEMMGQALPFASERRRAPRTKWEVPVRFSGQKQGDALPVIRTRDVSESAAGIVSATPLQEGQQTKVELAAPDGSTRSINCTVRRVRQTKEGTFEGFVEFEGSQPVFCQKRIRVA